MLLLKVQGGRRHYGRSVGFVLVDLTGGQSLALDPAESIGVERWKKGLAGYDHIPRVRLGDERV